MRLVRSLSFLAAIMLAGVGALARSDEPQQGVKEQALDAPHLVKVKVAAWRDRTRRTCPCRSSATSSTPRRGPRR